MLKEIRPDGTVVEHQSLTFSKAKKIVGGFVEVVNCRDGQTMLVNEDAHSLSLKPNLTATVFYYGKYIYIYPYYVLGTVIYGTRTEIDRIVS